MVLDLKFSSLTAQQFFFASKRNIAWCSGFGAGKSWAACQKAIALLAAFPGYRAVFGRKSATDLKKTTMQTFYKVCPPELYDERLGGRIVEGQIPYTEFVNKSRIYWIHLDPASRTSLRSLEINMAVTDQAEEVDEETYLELDNRVGRWDMVEVPQYLLDQYPNWPRNKFSGRPLAPAYNIQLFNPPDEGEFSYLYQRFHPESVEWQQSYRHSHQYFESSSRDNIALPEENLRTLLSRDSEYTHRFVEGKFGKGQGAVHQVSPLSYLEVDKEWVRKNVLKRGVLARVLDHGAASPTCCTWWSAVNGAYFAYREYYVAGTVISKHRRNITELSDDLGVHENYVMNLADPQIFKQESQKYGGFWTTANEYSDQEIDAPPIYWSPADNNEFATRNRIDELLMIDPTFKHPVTGIPGAPRIYFIKETPEYPNGCSHLIKELSSQKKELLAEINGKKVYGDNREESIADHAYDTLRYYCASHLKGMKDAKPIASPRSFMAIRNRMKALKILGSTPAIQ